MTTEHFQFGKMEVLFPLTLALSREKEKRSQLSGEATAANCSATRDLTKLASGCSLSRRERGEGDVNLADGSPS